VPEKKGCLGFSLPVIAGILLLFLVLLVVSFAVGPLGKSLLGGLELPSWLSALSIDKPDPKLPAETIFHLFGFPITNSIIGAWITIIFLVGFSWVVTRRMKLIPGRLQAAFEFFLGWLYDLCCSVAGEKNGRRFFPVVATIFLFVGFNAWLALLVPVFGSITIHTAEGVVSLLRPANTDINLPLALALTSFFFFWFFGLRSLRIRFLGNFFNFGEFGRGVKLLFKGKVKDSIFSLFTGVINIFSGFLELLSVCIRVVSLTFRLFGNMTAGEILLLVAAFLIPWIFALPFYGLELLIGFIQAIIFGGLTLIFLTMAVQSHEEEAH
jgi:F-type H+-transporting ATPase subunit a